jgi:hypothetical protein
MDLKKFISQSLVEIMTGLKEAQDALKDSQARICPAPSQEITPAGHNTMIAKSTVGRPIFLIEYDVAIEVSGEDTAGGKISVLGGLLGGGSNAQTTNADKTASRVQFSIPVSYPDFDELEARFAKK